MLKSLSQILQTNFLYVRFMLFQGLNNVSYSLKLIKLKQVPSLWSVGLRQILMNCRYSKQQAVFPLNSSLQLKIIKVYPRCIIAIVKCLTLVAT